MNERTVYNRWHLTGDIILRVNVTDVTFFRLSLWTISCVTQPFLFNRLGDKGILLSWETEGVRVCTGNCLKLWWCCWSHMLGNRSLLRNTEAICSLEWSGGICSSSSVRHVTSSLFSLWGLFSGWPTSYENVTWQLKVLGITRVHDRNWPHYTLLCILRRRIPCRHYTSRMGKQAMGNNYRNPLGKSRTLLRYGTYILCTNIVLVFRFVCCFKCFCVMVFSEV